MAFNEISFAKKWKKWVKGQEAHLRAVARCVGPADCSPIEAVDTPKFKDWRYTTWDRRRLLWIDFQEFNRANHVENIPEHVKKNMWLDWSRLDGIVLGL